MYFAWSIWDVGLARFTPQQNEQIKTKSYECGYIITIESLFLIIKIGVQIRKLRQTIMMV